MIDKTPAGSPPASLSTQLLIHVCEYMQVGEWYAWDDVVRVVTPRVPRLAAGRRGHADWARKYRKRSGHEPPARPVTSEALIRSGARIMIRWAVDNVRGDAFEWDGPRTTRRIRLRYVPAHVRPFVKVNGDEHAA